MIQRFWRWTHSKFSSDDDDVIYDDYEYDDAGPDDDDLGYDYNNGDDYDEYDQEEGDEGEGSGDVLEGSAEDEEELGSASFPLEWYITSLFSW